MTAVVIVKPVVGAFRNRPGGRRGARPLRAIATGPREVGGEPPTIDSVGFERHNIEERRHHFLRLDEARGAALVAHCAPRRPCPAYWRRHRG